MLAGWCAIRPACRERSNGAGRVRSEVQERAIQSIIICDRPDQLKIAFCLWSRATAGWLISQACGALICRFAASANISTRRGFTPQKPEAMQAWLGLRGECPGIEQRAKTEGAEIHRSDETARVNIEVAAEARREQGKHLWRWLWAVPATSCR